MVENTANKKFVFSLPELILTLRPDLCQRLRFDKPNNRSTFLEWLLVTGVKEYPSLNDDVSLRLVLNGEHSLESESRDKNGLSLLQKMVLRQRPDVRKAFPLPKKYKLFEKWFYTHGVEEMNLLPFLTPSQLQYVKNQPEPWKSRLRPILEQFESSREKSKRIEESQNLPFGVNLIGYAHGQLGIGEDLRMAARALLAAGIPVAVVNFPPGREIPQNDFSMKSLVRDKGPYAINIFCLTALEHGRYYAERGAEQMRGRYNIGYWPWELADWPREWRQLVCLVDEVWVSTSFTAESLRPYCPVPLLVMPMPVDIGDVAPLGRADFGLPEDATLFCFAFDLHSTMARKNPQACVAAFQEAFPRRRAWFGKQSGRSADEVGLVIKVQPPRNKHHAWEKLKKLASKDDRIHIIEKSLAREELLALYKCCDCFLSLHRAEGFGRGLAEALLLDLHLIATGYSGNMDFCAGYNGAVDLVNYRLVPIKKGEYPFSQGQSWAEADVGHAADLMRKFCEHSQRTAYADLERFSLAKVGARYRTRLDEVKELLTKTNYFAIPFPREHRLDKSFSKNQVRR